MARQTTQETYLARIMHRYAPRHARSMRTVYFASWSGQLSICAKRVIQQATRRVHAATAGKVLAGHPQVSVRRFRSGRARLDRYHTLAVPACSAPSSLVSTADREEDGAGTC